MKKKALTKDFIMEVKLSRNRFLSILLIVALGVAFFSGIRSTEPDMHISADNYYDESNLMDIRVLSTLGLTNKDVDYIKSVTNVLEVEPSYSLDALAVSNESEIVVKLLSNLDSMNQIDIIEGRKPENSGEAVIDSALVKNGTYKLGDVITLASGTKDDISKNLVHKEYTIVGIGNSAFYLSYSRGSASIGSGKISGFVVIPKEDFILDAYSEIYVTVDGAKEKLSYSDEYEELVESIVEEIEEGSYIRIDERYMEVTLEPKYEIEDGFAKLEEKEIEVLETLEDAWDKIQDGKIELEDGKSKIEEGWTEVNQGLKELENNKDKLNDGINKIELGKEDIAKAKEDIKNGKTLLNEKKSELAQGREAINEGYKKWDENYLIWSAGYDEIQINLDKIDAGITELNEKKVQLEPVKELFLEDYITLTETLEQLLMTKEELIDKQMELELAKVQIDAGKEQLDIENDKIEEGTLLLANEEDKLIESESLLLSQELELIKNEDELKQYQKELEDGEKKLAESIELLEVKEVELEEAKVFLSEKEDEYSEGREKAYKELEDARIELEDAMAKLEEIEKPKWYVLDRNSIQTYVEYGQDSQRIGNIGKVFPAIFFLVAALVSLTTMTRMIEEQRTQIGTLKALGYSKLSIARKYIYYALFATLLGSMLGILIGEKILPQVIINAYRILYSSLPKVITPYNMKYAVMSTIIAVGCITLTALLSCYKELYQVPANLMRPAAPKLGKRVFLERLTFLWKRLNFTSKSTIRNLIRYKKRFFMTVFGIGGCMALLLVGFGLKDSISASSDIQYVKLWHQDAVIGLDEKATSMDTEELYGFINNNHNYAKTMNVKEVSLDIIHKNKSKDASLLVIGDMNEYKEFITLVNRTTKESLELTDDSAIVTEKLANLLDIKVGDTITLANGQENRKDIKVSGITENYMLHYVFISPSTYESLYKSEPAYNKIYTKLVSKDRANEEDIGNELLTHEAVTSISFTSAFKEQMEDMLDSLNIVVYVLIVSAGLLAFIVLYNLNNINITERKRELATLKVLGFQDMEVANYVYRENILLTIMGALTGILLGIILHKFVILTTEIDAIMFGRNINLVSYVFSILLTFAFSGFVNYVMFYKLRKIDMVESLKSVE